MSYVKVSLLTCQQKVMCQTLRSTVLSCTKVEGGSLSLTLSSPNKQKSGNGGDKNKNSSPLASPVDGPRYHVVCEDSVLFPKGGGQACDYGWLYLSEEALQRSMNDTALEFEGIHITRVEREGDCCVMTSPVPLPVGEPVWQKVDWPRRLDNMQHHTAQHLLTAVVEQILGIQTMSVAFAEPYAYIQLDMGPLLKDPPAYPIPDCLQAPSSTGKKSGVGERQLTPTVLHKIQERCNALIADPNSNVNICIYPSREACMKEMSERASGSRFRSRSIPEDVTGPIRTIIINGVDECTCCGTHVEHLSQLNALYLIPHQDVKNNIIKLFFVVGQRAAAYYEEMCRRERDLTIQLNGCRPQDFLKELQERSKANTQVEKKMKRWTEELAVLQVATIFGSSPVSDSQYSTLPYRVLVHRREDVDMDYFMAFRKAMDDLGHANILLVAGWVQESAAKGTPAQGQVWVAESLVAMAANAKKKSKKPQKESQSAVAMGEEEAVPPTQQVSLVTPLVAFLQDVFLDLKGGLSNQGYRGKSTIAASAVHWEEMKAAMLKTLQELHEKGGNCI